MRQAFRYLCFGVLVTVPFHTAHARSRQVPSERVRSIAPPAGATDNPAGASRSVGFSAAAATETTLLYSATFGNGPNCSAQGWTSVDLTTQPGDYWHVDDYAGLSFAAIEGTKSLWCGARPQGGEIFCTYQALPGYGNGWNQSWCTKSCLSITGGPTPDLDVSFALRYDSEPSYDATSLQYTIDCDGNVGWSEIDGGNPTWSGIDQITVNGAYNVYNGTTVKVRLHFTSDWSWSDQDLLYNSNGAAHVDSLKVESLPIELFEDEPVGAISSSDWESCNTPGYGDLAGLFSGSSLLQEDPCATNISCMWAFIVGSTETYACGGHPEQTVIPYVNVRNEYLSNEIWSPWIPVADAGKILNLQFSVYRHLPLDTQIHYVWHVRSLVNGCPTPWQDRNFVYYGEDREWFQHVEDIGAMHYVAGATHFQVALGAIDFCPWHCGVFGSGDCHTHAPLFDNVKIYSVDMTGPHWNVRDIDTFQDTFATDGTTTGTARANAAIDIKPSSSPTVTPGDSALVLYLKDPLYAMGAGTNASGLSDDPNISTFVGRHKTKKQVYMYVAVWPIGQPGKSGAALAGTTKSLTNPSGVDNGTATRYFFAGTIVASGVTWTKIRMDYTYTGTATNAGDGDGPTTDTLVASRFNVDLNDNVFEPGDTVCYFYGATSPGGTTYFSTNLPGATGPGNHVAITFTTRSVTASIDEAAANPMEFTILPAGGWRRGGHVLYVDGADGLGDQPYFEGAFQALGLADKIDRFDVRDPSTDHDNTPATRVYNVANQLTGIYNAILWDCGTLPVTLNGGKVQGQSDKSNEYALLNQFLAQLTVPGGVYLCGDDIAERLFTMSTSSATTFKSSYMPFTLASNNHMNAALGVSPSLLHWPSRCFSDDVVAFGGCPAFNDFDVLTSAGTSQIEMSYGSSEGAGGAVLSNINGNARVILSGLSFAFIRDDEVNGISDRAQHLHDILAWLGASAGSPTPVGVAASNSLSQNYPNPFNPQTTIAFSLKGRAHVEISIYDVGGRLVRTLANETRAPGAHQLTWDGRDGRGSPVASAVYFYRLTTPGFSQTKKMVLLK